MGPKCAVTKEQAIETIIRYKSHLDLALISQNYKSDLPAYTSDVWKNMSKEYGNAWRFNHWYINIRENRRNIFTEARERLGIRLNEESVPLNNSERLYEDEQDSDNGSVCSIEPEVRANESLFELYLSQEQWQRMKPLENDSTKKRTTHTLKPHVWSNIIALEFFKQHRLPCAYVFERAEINTSTSRKHFLKITGRCRDNDCNNYFFGYADQEPCDHGEFLLTVRTRDTSFEDHKEVKRVVNGAYRKELGKVCAAEGCHNVQKSMARKYLKRGDAEGPMIPSLDVLHHAKQEFQDEELGIPKKHNSDPILAIYNMQFEPSFLGSIQDIGYNPFFVFYGTPEQRTIYLQYLNHMKGSASVSIDASGSMVRKLKRQHGLKSAHLFLYCIVINFNEKFSSVYQILTESHENETIEYGLKRWLRQVRRQPNVITQDYERALLIGCSNAFNGISIKKYVDNAFYSITKNGGVAGDYASTYIRVDVAHLIHMACRWDCLKTHHSRLIRDFFIRCIALLVDCQDLADFREIFGLTCVVALQNYEDTAVNKFANTAKDARIKLQDYLSLRKVDINGYLTILGESEKPAEYEYAPVAHPEEVTTSISPIETYINDIITAAGVETNTGREVNGFYLPKFVTQLHRIGKEFPLWSAVGMPSFVGHATSSSSESNFNDLKNRVFKDHPNGLRVDKFVAKHLLDLTGGTRLMASKIIQARIKKSDYPKFIKKTTFDVNRKIPVNCGKSVESNEKFGNDSDVFSRENWRGKAASPVFHQDRSGVDEECKYLLSIIRNEHDYLNTSSDPINEQDSCFSANKENLAVTDYINKNIVDEKQNSIQGQTKNKTTITENNNRTKFFNPCPEIKYLNQLKSHPRKSYLLRNGNLCPAVRGILGGQLHVKNTCGFDSIAHILYTAALDDDNYKSFIEKSNVQFLSFVKNFMQNGPKVSTYKERATILLPYYKEKLKCEVANKRVIVRTMDVTDSIANIWDHLLESQPSAHRKIHCDKCGESVQSLMTLYVHDHGLVVREGFSALQYAIQFSSVACRPCRKNGCDGSVTHTTETNDHLLIEIDVKDVLAGVIQHAAGHFTYFNRRRSSGRFEFYNDTDTKVDKTIKSTRIIEPKA
ncbi:unnamed protein product [Ceutorhynchus assimilis]|uniref:Uncharacterized protein n=1 Tax=Ceutorhynchus assimilis TaxID=467358 RepID=A0A9N9MU24_9CUCU|nr:unnamed protein product [Ceutorhynchus assimilis]